MKGFVNLLVLAGFAVAAAAVAGRFYGAPTIVGFSGTALLSAANTCFLSALVINTLKK